MNSRMSKVKRLAMIGLAVGTLAMSSIACDDPPTPKTATPVPVLAPAATPVPVDVTIYNAIQDGQDAIQEAGNDVKVWIEDSEIDAPTGVDVGEGLMPVLEDLINDNCD